MLIAGIGLALLVLCVIPGEVLGQRPSALTDEERMADPDPIPRDGKARVLQPLWEEQRQKEREAWRESSGTGQGTGGYRPTSPSGPKAPTGGYRPTSPSGPKAPVPPTGQSGSSQPAPSAVTAPVPSDRPAPAHLALWTDRPGYRAGEMVRLHYTIEARADRSSYQTFFYLEPAGGGERRYLAPLAPSPELLEQPVDHYGLPEGAARAQRLEAASKAIAWEGEAPAPGLWQFVMELRPADGNAAGTRRAWANFTVASRRSLWSAVAGSWRRGCGKRRWC